MGDDGVQDSDDGDWDYSGADDVTAGDDNGGDGQTADGLIFSWVRKIIGINTIHYNFRQTYVTCKGLYGFIKKKLMTSICQEIFKVLGT